ncbi:MAG TPA: MFS transporter, partial [bacterium]
MVKQIKKVAGKIGHFRWTICALLFFAATINYIDRQVIGVLKPTHILTWPGWSELAYGRVISGFQLAYAAMMLVAGVLVDRIGIRKGFVIAVIWWSFAAMGHAISGTVLSFAIWRVMLGIGEAANFPASIKAVAEWFPKKERALATGIFNAGTNVGAMVTAPMVALILATLHHWQWVFIATGSLGFFWAALWWFVYRRPEEHSRLSKPELAYIQSGGKEKTEKMPWAPLLKFKQTWAFAIGKGLTDPVWWIWLFWVPGFLYQRFGVDIKSMSGALIVIYLMA